MALKKGQSLTSVALNRPRFDCVFKLQRQIEKDNGNLRLLEAA